MTLIRILSADPGGRTPVGVDGRIVEIPHDRAASVSAAQLHVLANSNVAFEIVDGAAATAPEAPGEAERGVEPASPEPRVAGFLGRPIRAIAPELATLGADRLEALAAAELARAKPRVTLLALLNRRRAGA